ncbi:ferric-chelate reductase 1-like [Actinia tenebrosa]|uniref:Ferric-chelate reductase 1-like n=1 Tax=Actinia tenebrosa TaxID=6105 RepID=A0A6P8H4P4_ACTTE|nr:ferric-chelate reductase 1-like [Actinia tenebrosa]
MKMIVILLAVLVFPSSHAFPDHVPTTVCEEMHPHHDSHQSQPIASSPYNITVSSANYTPGAEVTVIITGSMYFKGFMVQARSEGKPANPVGSFQDPLPLYTGHLWCSGGEPKNTVGHEHKAKVNFTSVSLKWTAPSVSAGNISFWVTVVHNFTTFWDKQKSSIVTGLAAPSTTQPTLEGDFQISKTGCGVTKSCYSEPSSCSNSQDCIFLVTYKDNGDNVTFEISSKLGYGSVGFNDKQAMNGTDSITCSTSATNVVEVRQYYLDNHQPIRYDLRSSSDITRHQGVYANGIVKCRFSRKKVPQGPKMRNLNNNWYLIFAWSKVGSTGVLAYHFPNASYTPTTVDVQKPANLTNGRQTPPAPTSSPGDKITKADCGKTKGCYSEPSSCQSSDDCQYLLTYKADKDKVTFEMSFKAGWGAIGFNSKGKMDGTDAIICSLESSQVIVAHYDIKGYGAPIKNIQGTSSLKIIAGKNSAGVVQCRFSRPVKEPNMMDLNNKVFLIFARGSVGNAGGLRKHSHKSNTLKTVDISSTEDLDVGGKNMRLLRAHAILMSLAWLVCASLAMFIARYMKPVWGELLGLKAWFQIHRLLMVFTLFFTIVGVVLVFIYVEGWSEGYMLHSIIGILVLLLTCIQPVMAFFRPGPVADNRFIFNWAHRSVGLSALVLAIVNCFLGVFMPHFGIKNTGVYPLIVYCAAVVMVILFELVLLLRNDKNSFEVINEPKAKLKDGEVEVTTKQTGQVNTKAPAEKNILLKKIVFGVLVLLVSGACVALIILLCYTTSN